MIISSISLIKWGVASFLIGIAVVYYVGTKAKIHTLQENNAKYDFALREQFDLVQSQKRDIEEIKSMYKETIIYSEQLQENINKLENKFNYNSAGNERDFGNIARTKPGLVEKIINNATKLANECIEKAIRGEEDEKCNSVLPSSDS